MIRMNRSHLLILLMLLITAPWSASASTLSVIPAPAASGQEFSIQVRLLPEDEHLNVVEGNIRIPDGLSVISISTGGSALTLWPTPPSFSRSKNIVSFAGGTTTELPTGQKPLLFTLYVRAETPGIYSLAPEDIVAFRADGTGTSISVSAPLSPVTVGKEAVPAEDKTDHRAPDSLEAVVGHDTSLFGGAPFVYFYGSDAGTGIAKYQVKEGWFGTYADASQYYVLTDAAAGKPVWIRAIDAAGNTRTTHVAGTGDLLYYGVFVMPVLLIILLALVIMRRKRHLL